jgi:hypothetical protein
MKVTFTPNVDGRRIARAYIALAFAQDVAKGYIKDRREEDTLHPLLTALDMSAKLLEEILEDVLPVEEETEQVTLIM